MFMEVLDSCRQKLNLDKDRLVRADQSLGRNDLVAIGMVGLQLVGEHLAARGVFDLHSGA